MTKPFTVTVGIPAHNEEANIRQLLQSIVSQKGNFVLEKIIVVCDGCTDNTETLAYEVVGVEILNDHNRRGKPVRINELFHIAQSDIIVIVDADIYLVEGALDAITHPFYNNSNIMLASGNLTPLPVKNFVGQMAFAIVDLWDTAMNMVTNAEMYRCNGPLRAFRRPFYLQFTFPPLSADDIYPYFVCKQLNYQFAYICESLGSYKLPTTLFDLQKQMKRFLDSDKIHKQTFGLDFIKQFYTITPLIKFKALLKTLPKHPLSTIGYLMSWLPIKFAVMILRPSLHPTWDSVRSTK
jgi:glycosyltransferase involved in cell wall biosynthesis